MKKTTEFLRMQRLWLCVIAAAAVLSCGGGGGGGGGGPYNPPGSIPDGGGEEPNDDFALGIEMVLINCGTFFMGSPAAEPSRDVNETQHKVTLTEDFYIGRYPVTQKQFFDVMGGSIEERQELSMPGDTSNYGRGKNYPMYFVNWYEAVIFCNKLSELEGYTPSYHLNGETDTDKWVEDYGDIPAIWNKSSPWNSIGIVSGSTGYRLPTEAQWEYARRGDYLNKSTEEDTKPFGIGDGTKMTSGMANFNGKKPYDIAEGGDYDDPEGIYLEQTIPVGKYGDVNAEANSYGLYDMYGNVNDWCWDWYAAFSSAAETDPEGSVVSYATRILRGGSWLSVGMNLRSAKRGTLNPNTRNSGTGFRLVRPSL